MRRLILLFALVVAGSLAAPAVSEAALTCPSFGVSQPTWDANSNLAVTWSARCNGAVWTIELYLQYESGGVWHLENCAGSQPCQINRPTSGSFPAGSSQGGTVHFNPLNGCDVRFRSFMLIDKPNGDQFGPFTGPANHTC